ncbi:MAG: hypothetical protein K9J12_05360 [Melioribacteraceae bacterium]|nr:hypothetical protein [Melioribacteraceae bacterium]MCF8264477.1 hypothetical protein [Melioribacteraceae bacterium]
MSKILKDLIIFSPKDVDLSHSPLSSLGESTNVLGAFNPALTKLPNGNLLIMVRVAEKLLSPTENGNFRFIRWDSEKGYVLESVKTDLLITDDPRKYEFKNRKYTTYGLTSFSWLLPVELNDVGSEVLKIHYERIIQPQQAYQEYGIEDARLTQIDQKYYMTTCSVSSFRHSTTLYVSEDGLNYKLEGIIQDHQNKDMVLFPENINGFYYALTRPVGDHYFHSNTISETIPGPGICMSRSPDLLHWKPVEDFIIQPKLNTLASDKLGGGANPILTDEGWLVLFHGVSNGDVVGKYSTMALVLDKNEPYKIKTINLSKPILKSFEELPEDLEKISYIDDVVFTSGIVEKENYFIVASGERDLCCRITHLEKSSLTNLL